MKNIELNKIKELLKAYEIPDVENYSFDYISEEDTIQHYSLSEAILQQLYFLKSNIKYEKERNIQDEEISSYLQDLVKLHNFFTKCKGEIKLSGNYTTSQGLKSKMNITINSYSIAERIINELDEMLCQYEHPLFDFDDENLTESITSNNWDYLLDYYKIHKKETQNSSLGNSVDYIIGIFNLYKWKVTKQRLFSFVYDLLLVAGLVYRDDCKEIGEENGGREKSIQVKDWLKAYNKDRKKQIT